LKLNALAKISVNAIAKISDNAIAKNSNNAIVNNREVWEICIISKNSNNPIVNNREVRESFVIIIDASQPFSLTDEDMNVTPEVSPVAPAKPKLVRIRNCNRNQLESCRRKLFNSNASSLDEETISTSSQQLPIEVEQLSRQEKSCSKRHHQPALGPYSAPPEVLLDAVIRKQQRTQEISCSPALHLTSPAEQSSLKLKQKSTQAIETNSWSQSRNRETMEAGATGETQLLDKLTEKSIHTDSSTATEDHSAKCEWNMEQGGPQSPSIHSRAIENNAIVNNREVREICIISKNSNNPIVNNREVRESFVINIDAPQPFSLTVEDMNVTPEVSPVAPTALAPSSASSTPASSMSTLPMMRPQIAHESK
jgi:hypothetical protein